jgi:hypothetical protein
MLRAVETIFIDRTKAGLGNSKFLCEGIGDSLKFPPAVDRRRKFPTEIFCSDLGLEGF